MAPLPVALLVMACSHEAPDPVPRAFGPLIDVEAPTAVATLPGVVWVASDTDVHRHAAVTDALGREGLPEGTVRWLAAADTQTLFADVHGKGLYRSTDGAQTWSAFGDGLDAPTLALLNSTATPVPLDLAVASDGIYLASAGGLFRSVDGGPWTLLDVSDSGTLNVLYTGVDTFEEQRIAVSVLPEGIIPIDFAGFLSGTVIHSEDGGESWEDLSPEFPSLFPTSVAFDAHGISYVGTMDQGVIARVAETWQPLEGGPSDVVAVDVVDGVLTVGSASRGAWSRRADGSWSAVGNAGVLGLGNGFAVDTAGGVFELVDGEGEDAPESAGGTIHIALSFHVNYYHSYRGDEPTEDGFGLDIDVIRNTLDWLDARPEVRADWDSDNAFTTDDWMPEYSPDILERIAARVAAGTDDIRLMSYNNGAMSASTYEEFVPAVELAKDSLEAAFGEYVPGVQPQECMFTPDHLRWYPELGIEWVTLFYAANGFTALRQDVDLAPEDLHGPFTLYDPDDPDARMTTVPVYHHADVMDHGGLAGWARQLHDRLPGDSLLVVHFDADSETWERFDQELDAVMELDFVEFTTIATYLDDHPPGGEYPLYGDVADGTGDGYQSWAEKSFNHDIWTQIALSRDAADVARLLDPDNPAVQQSVDNALSSRLLALSTTHFGLASPLLHDDRVAAASYWAEEAKSSANTALLASGATSPAAPGTIEAINPRNSAGPALVSFNLTLPPGSWAGPQGLSVLQPDGAAAPVVANLSGSSPDGDAVAVQGVLQVEAADVTTFTWSYDPGGSADYGLTSDDVPHLDALEAPFSDCSGERTVAEATEESVGVDDHGASATSQTSWSMPLCGAPSEVDQTLEVWADLPGTVVRVEASLGGDDVIDDLQSVVLAPLRCEGGATELRWLTHGGVVRTRPARTPVESWNGQAADGWVELTCAGGDPLVVAHRVGTRSSMAFAPLQNEGDEAILAPLGTLWGDSPWHNARHSWGLGLGDIVVPVVGSQFRPYGPDWGGEEVLFELLVGSDIDDSARDLFAHPPHVRVGAYAGK